MKIFRRENIMLALSLMGGVLLASCSNDDVVIDNRPELIPTTDIPALDQWYMSNDEKDVSYKLWDFSFRLFKEVASTDEIIDKDPNLCISPFSIILDVLLVANSADDSFRRDIAKMLDIDDMEVLNEYLNKLIRNIVAKNEMTVGNSIWYNTDSYSSVSTDYMNAMMETFYANVYGESFTHEATVGVMNEWVERATSGYVHDMFTADMLLNSNLWFVNSLYYGASWLTPFDSKLTRKEEFRNYNGETESVQMMHNELITSYGEKEDYTYASLATATSDFTFILPKIGKKVEDIAQGLSLDNWLNSGSVIETSNVRYDVNISLPKFGMESDYDITKSLAALGMPETMVPQLMGLTPASNNSNAIEVIQKMFTSIDESGVKVATTTSIGAFETSNGNAEPKIVKVDFVLNRPFLYFIRHRSSGAIIMMGYVNKL